MGKTQSGFRGGRRYGWPAERSTTVQRPLYADRGRLLQGQGWYANWYANQPDSGGVQVGTPTYGKHSDLQKLDTHEHRRTHCLYLGVKWSQVQILSARPLFRCYFWASQIGLFSGLTHTFDPNGIRGGAEICLPIVVANCGHGVAARAVRD